MIVEASTGTEENMNATGQAIAWISNGFNGDKMGGIVLYFEYYRRVVHGFGARAQEATKPTPEGCWLCGPSGLPLNLFGIGS